MNLFWLWLISLVFLASESQCSSITGIDFSSGNADEVKVTTKPGFDLDKGGSNC